MNWSPKQIIYFIYSVVSIIFCALWAAEASFLSFLNSWTWVGIFALFFLIIPLILVYRKRKFFYEISIKNKGLLYSQTVCLFILELLISINKKENFLNSPDSLELFTWMIKFALFISIIRVIRPLSFEEWSQKF